MQLVTHAALPKHETSSGGILVKETSFPLHRTSPSRCLHSKMGKKREHDGDTILPDDTGGSPGNSTTNFRNVSAWYVECWRHDACLQAPMNSSLSYIFLSLSHTQADLYIAAKLQMPQQKESVRSEAAQVHKLRKGKCQMHWI